MSKVCPDCKTEGVFYENRAHFGGLSTHCRPCTRERARVYAKTPAGKAITDKRTRAMRHKYREKVSARDKVKYAVRKGWVVKPTNCENCEQSKKLQAHHDDYSLPLSVRWLCDPCHKLTHGKLVDFSLLTRKSKEKQLS